MSFPFELPPAQSHTVVGYHGTDAATAVRVLKDGFQPSTGPTEWLGQGVYFWTFEDAATDWALKRIGFVGNPVVLRANIYLGRCLDLDDADRFKPLLSAALAELKSEWTAKNKPPLKDTGDEKYLFCAIVNRAAESTFPPPDTITMTFAAGPELYPGAPLRTGATRQICVRSLQCIHAPEKVA